MGNLAEWGMFAGPLRVIHYLRGETLILLTFTGNAGKRQVFAPLWLHAGVSEHAEASGHFFCCDRPTFPRTTGVQMVWTLNGGGVNDYITFLTLCAFTHKV